MGCGIARSRGVAPQTSRGGVMGRRFSSLGDFEAPPTKTNYTTPHYYPKYEIRAIEKKLWDHPFKNLR